MLRPSWLADDPAPGSRHVTGWSLLRDRMVDEELLALQHTSVRTRSGRTITLQLITPYAHFVDNDSSAPQAAAALSALAAHPDLSQRVTELHGRGRAMPPSEAGSQEYCVRVFFDSDTRDDHPGPERLLIGTPLWVRTFLAPIRPPAKG